jgi:signal transduction histidine kinase
MQQVIRNLWQNALDAVEPGGHVRVRTRLDGQVVVLEVQDDGSGINREDLRRIFTPFFTTKDPGKGMGLGLAIAHQVVSQAGGVISVESLPGKGTAFRVRLPVHPGSADGEAAKPPDDSILRRTGLTLEYPPTKDA